MEILERVLNCLSRYRYWNNRLSWGCWLNGAHAGAGTGVFGRDAEVRLPDSPMLKPL